MQQQYQSQDRQAPERSDQQEYRNSSVAMGVVSHALKLAGSLSPLLILEFVKEPTKAHRWIRIASIATTGLNETLWACRVNKSRGEERHR